MSLNYEVLNSLWMEKYRPQDLDSIVLNQDTRRQLEKFVSDGIIPNLFLCSRPGQGKTSLSKLLAYNVFDCNTLYVNCSDENDVNTVRNKVTNFANTLSDNGRFKIIILDEADGFANIQSQKILRVLMEEVSDNTRFILTANYRDKVIEPLRSRCVELQLVPDIRETAKRVLNILRYENIEVNPEQGEKLMQLIKNYFPDIRTIIKYVQLSIDKDGQLNILSANATREILDDIFEMIIKGEECAMQLREHLIKSESAFGHDYARLLVDFYRFIVNSDGVSSERKCKWVIQLAEHVYRSNTVIDQELNTIACFISLMHN